MNKTIFIHMIDSIKLNQEEYRVPNLHLLFGRGNASKSDMPLQEYYDDMTEAEQEAFKQNSYIPDESLNIINFANFYDKRKELLIEKIKSLII